ncbi:MAG: M23 family metallopeptidase [Salinivirgaceae bacterium]|nr:M23 family metallopeptidase [Salinivirgaceae bacterium]
MILHKLIKFSHTIILIFIVNTTFSQLQLDTLGWIPPVDIPIYLAGNFAELRTGHFHAGIDIKTHGKEGFKIYAVQGGYISRIKISSTGYGKAIYICHPDGYTSVYGHMKEYNIQLEKYVRAVQYQKESYELDIFPEKDELMVNQGDIIGLSGNTGGSSGPHLHFEVRDTRTSKPLNALFLGYDIPDNISPKMYYLYVYPKTTSSHVNENNSDHFYSLKKLNGHYQLRRGDTVEAFGNIGLGLKVNDFINGSANRCGVYQLKVYINNELYFHNKFDGFSFSETRYINSLMDFKENVEKKRKLHKLFIDPNNELSVYVNSLQNGIVTVKNNEFYTVRIEAYDVNENKSSLEFVIKGTEGIETETDKENILAEIPWQNDFLIDTTGISVYFPEECFYDTCRFSFNIDTQKLENTYSNVFQIHNRFLPVHKRFQLAIKYDSVPDSLKYKLLLAKIINGKMTSSGGSIEDDKIIGSLRELGSYTVTLDTTPPLIKALGNSAEIGDLSNLTSISFLLTDNFSGIDVYRGFVNGKWVLFEWDAKNDFLKYEFDEFMPKEGLIDIRLEVWDERGNFSMFHKTYIKNTL